MLLEPFITFMARALARPIFAGSDRSTLPGPSDMTNICPMPTITAKEARDRAAMTMPPAPKPRVNTSDAMKTIAAPAKDQIHGLALLWQIGRGSFVEEFGAVGTSPARRAHEEVKDGLPDGRQARLWRRSPDSFFSVPRP